MNATKTSAQEGVMVTAQQRAHDEPERRRAALLVADLFGERGTARSQIKRLIVTLGLDFLAATLAVVADAFEQDDPSLLRRSMGRRARTAGGVFFHVVRRTRERWRSTVSPEDWRRLFPSRSQKARARKARDRLRLEARLRLAALPAASAQPGEVWCADFGAEHDDGGTTFVTLLVLDPPNGPAPGMLYGWLLGLGPARLGWRDVDRTRGGTRLGSEWRRVA